MAPTQPLGWKLATIPLPLQNCWRQLPSGAGANRAAGSQQAVGTSERPCWSRTWHRRLLREDWGGLSTPRSAPPCSLYQIVKSTGTGFSFPPKLDKLESNERVRGKIKSSTLLLKKTPKPKKPPFADFLSENITDIIRCGT